MKKILPFLLFLSTTLLSGQWNEITTEHFQIIYEQEDEPWARKLEGLCEKVFQDVCSSLSYFPKEKVPLIIRGRTDESNGYFTFFPPSVNLFLASGALPTVRGENWLPLLLTHEFTHYVHLTRPSNWTQNLIPIFGPHVSSLFQSLMPGWIIEGITVYNESELTGLGRRNDPFFELQMKAPILENKLWNFDQAATLSRFPHPFRSHYVSGYYLVDYLQRTYGPDTFKKIIDTWGAFPFGGFDQPLTSATGHKAQEVWEAMTEELKIKFAPSLVHGEGEKGSGTQDIFEIQKTKDNLWAYVQNNQGEFHLGTLSEDMEFTSKMKVPPLGDNSFTLSQDEKYLAFSTMEDELTLDGSVPRSYLHLVELSLNQERILEPGLSYPSFNPTKNTLALVKRRGPDHILLEKKMDSSETTVLWDKPGSSALRPSWSPSGLKIAFEETSEQGSSLRILSPEGQITLGPFLQELLSYPRWVDETHLSYSSHQEGELVIYEWNTLTGEVLPKVKDFIGAFGGIQWKDSWYYLTYRSEGWTLRKKQEVNYPITVFTENLNPLKLHLPSADVPPRAIAQKHYDFPVFVGWLPEFTYETSGANPKQNMGLSMSFVSPRDQNTLALSFLWDLKDQGPLGQIRWDWRFLGGQATLGYLRDEVNDNIFYSSWGINSSSQLSHGNLINSLVISGFTLPNFNAVTIGYYQKALTLSQSLYPWGASRYYSQEPGVFHSLNVAVVAPESLPIFPGTNYTFAGNLQLLSWVKLGGKTDLRYSPSFAWSSELRPMGFSTGNRLQNLRWKVLGELELATPKVDAAWYGLGWQQAALTLVWEKLGGMSSLALWDREDYLSLELGQQLKVNLASFKLKIRGTFRIINGGFNFPQDFNFQFALGL